MAHTEVMDDSHGSSIHSYERRAEQFIWNNLETMFPSIPANETMHVDISLLPEMEVTPWFSEIARAFWRLRMRNSEDKSQGNKMSNFLCHDRSMSVVEEEHLIVGGKGNQ